MQAELSTLGNADDTNWRALWTNDGIYVFVTVADDEFLASYNSGITFAPAAWQYDKMELYFDVNYVLVDGGGATTPRHYQVGPNFAAALENGQVTTLADGVVHVFIVANPTYVKEYFVPWSKLKDRDGVAFDKYATLGFNVTVIDRDAGDAARKRAVWFNDGLNDGGNEPAAFVFNYALLCISANYQTLVNSPFTYDCDITATPSFMALALGCLPPTANEMVPSGTYILCLGW